MAWFGPARNRDHPGDRPPRWAPIGRPGRLVFLVTVIIGIVIALLVVATQTVSAVDGSNIADDQPSPETPPWFGGRVEMSEHGFAVTFPDGWVVFDLAGDADAQLHQALRVHQGESVLADVFRAYLLSVESSGGELFAIDSRTFDWCLIAVLPDVGTELDHLAERAFASLSDRHTDVDGPEVVNLPVGPARRIGFGDMVESAASYFVEASGEQFTVMCGGLRSTGDNWLSIPETFELLPDEP